MAFMGHFIADFLQQTTVSFHRHQDSSSVSGPCPPSPFMCQDIRTSNLVGNISRCSRRHHTPPLQSHDGHSPLCPQLLSATCPPGLHDRFLAVMNPTICLQALYGLAFLPALFSFLNSFEQRIIHGCFIVDIANCLSHIYHFTYGGEKPTSVWLKPETISIV